MKTFKRGVAHFFAMICSILFTITAVASLVLINVDQRLLNAATYKQALASQQVYTRLPRIIAEQLVTSLSYNPCAANPLLCENASSEFLNCAKNALGEERFTALSDGSQPLEPADKQQLQPCLDRYPMETTTQQAGGAPSFLKGLGVAEWETIISSLVPPDEIKTMTEDTLDQFFAYLDGQQDTVTVSLVDLKRSISSQAGLDAILSILRAQPACTLDEVGKIVSGMLTGWGDTFLCSPPASALDLFKPLLQEQVQLLAGAIPDKLELLGPQPGENQGNPGPFGSGPVGGLRFLRFVLHLSPDLALFFLLLVSLLAVRTPRGWLRWWGIPTFFAGLLSVGATIAASGLFEQFWLTILTKQIPAYLSLGLVTLGHDVGRSVFQSFLNGIALGGVLLTALGLGMWIGSRFVKPKGGSQAPTPPDVK
jgi:hypothetical protein